jgi:hypothetical protein
MERDTMQTTKGMVQVEGKTYRIVRLRAGGYEVVRVLDDVRVGRFELGPPITTHADHVEVPLLRAIARAAIQQARTTWVGIPTFE